VCRLNRIGFKHPAVPGGLGDDLRHVPSLNELAVVIKAADVDLAYSVINRLLDSPAQKRKERTWPIRKAEARRPGGRR
jgi:hypothetical protein